MTQEIAQMRSGEYMALCAGYTIHGIEKLLMHGDDSDIRDYDEHVKAYRKHKWEMFVSATKARWGGKDTNQKDEHVKAYYQYKQGTVKYFRGRPFEGFPLWALRGH